MTSASDKYFGFRWWRGQGHVHIVLVRWFIDIDHNKRRVSIDKRPWPWACFGLRASEMRRVWLHYGRR